MVLDQLKVDLTDSLKKHDAVRVETIRFLLSAIRNVAIEKYGAKGEASLTDEDVLAVVRRQVKTHKESIEAFSKAGRSELVARESAQLSILESLLPKGISDEELARMLSEVVSGGETNFGLLMKQAIVKVGGKAEGGRVAKLLQEMVQKK